MFERVTCHYMTRLHDDDDDDDYDNDDDAPTDTATGWFAAWGVYAALGFRLTCPADVAGVGRTCPWGCQGAEWQHWWWRSRWWSPGWAPPPAPHSWATPHPPAMSRWHCASHSLGGERATGQPGDKAKETGEKGERRGMARNQNGWNEFKKKEK